MNRPLNRLLLGPIVGHTDAQSTRVWIQVADDPAWYTLRIAGRGLFPFVSTENGSLEFGTALADANGLDAERKYRYQILRLGRAVPGAHGTFRTMPPPGSSADVLFVSLSCSEYRRPGAWPLLDKYVKQAKPRFILMTGDQVYLDFGNTDRERIWPAHLHSTSDVRRQAMVYRYQQNWGREPIRRIMANTPTYMLWSDHDIRDGWGSWASDSPTLQEKYPRGAAIAAAYNHFFEDARDVYWHFQACHNPAPPAFVQLPLQHGLRQAIPFSFQCGRLQVLLLDDRGDRDLWRDSYPVLGNDQWRFVKNEFVPNLEANVDVLAIVTQAPIVTMSPKGESQTRLGHRMDDVVLFSQGKGKELLALQKHSDTRLEYAEAFVDRLVFKDALPNNDLHISDFDEARDQWSHYISRPEQERLIRLAGTARTTNRITSAAREVLFLGGDIHSGALFDISVSEPSFKAQCLISSGIGQARGHIVGAVVDDNFEVAPGIRAKLRHFVGAYNFGITHILFSGGKPVVNNFIAHSDKSRYLTVKLI